MRVAFSLGNFVWLGLSERSIRIDHSCIMTHGSVARFLGRATHYCES